MIGCALSVVLAVALSAYIGIMQSIRLMTSPVPGALAAAVVPLTAPHYDAAKPTVAIVLGTGNP